MMFGFSILHLIFKLMSELDIKMQFLFENQDDNFDERYHLNG
jgi:hypothetical protein